jgi:hypothetical protein
MLVNFAEHILGKRVAALGNGAQQPYRGGKIAALCRGAGVFERARNRKAGPEQERSCRYRHRSALAHS